MLDIKFPGCETISHLVCGMGEMNRCVLTGGKMCLSHRENLLALLFGLLETGIITKWVG